MSDLAVACPSCGHPNQALQATAVATQGSGAFGVEYASWIARVGAYIIDAIVIGVPSAIIIGILGVGFARSSNLRINPNTGRITGTAGSGFFAGFFVSLLIVLVAGVLYKVLMEGNPRGQTLGKMALGIRVRDAETGGPITYGKAAIRWLVAWVLWAAFYIGGIIDALFPLWDSRKQALHDKAAGTIVVKA
jgi:uncharacterized RDD family membrane protein YckC